MNTLWQDLRYGIRVLLNSRGFTLAAVFCLALGIGATTAIFTVVDAVVMRPLPYLEPQRLVRIYSEFPTFPGGGLRRFWISPPEFLDLERDAKQWESINGWVNGGANLAGADEPIRVTASYVTGNLMRTLGVSPLLGRLVRRRTTCSARRRWQSSPTDSGNAVSAATRRYLAATLGWIVRPA